MQRAMHNAHPHSRPARINHKNAKRRLACLGMVRGDVLRRGRGYRQMQHLNSCLHVSVRYLTAGCHVEIFTGGPARSAKRRLADGTTKRAPRVGTRELIYAYVNEREIE
ncbi:unnamed protein product [Periconia digitata]|uniref:Uncharacterized protein n=1 Tax=Periconia digitata TaxID=1303443 RepID=A0A9W4XMB5_9PLEO|nr:unnamed protein product [Periconia digitata]